MKRALVVLVLIFFGIAGLGASFFATTQTFENHTLFGAFTGIPLPETCYPNMALYLETYMIDEIAVFNGGVGCVAKTEGFEVAGALGLLNAFPVAIAWANVLAPNLEIFGKVSLGPLTSCYYPCSVWNVDLVASLQTDILINLWFKDVFLPEMRYGRMDISLGCKNVPFVLGIDTERINFNKFTHPYLGTFFKFENVTIIPKIYFAPCNLGFGLNLYGQF